jgi:hypothetical protein
MDIINVKTPEIVFRARYQRGVIGETFFSTQNGSCNLQSVFVTNRTGFI